MTHVFLHLSAARLKQVDLLEKEKANAEAERVQRLQQRVLEMKINEERMLQQHSVVLATSRSSSESRAAQMQHMLQLEAENREFRRLLYPVESERRKLGQNLKEFTLYELCFK